MPDFNKSTYDQEYTKQNIMRIPVNINRKTDSELAGWLETIENRQGYIKELIRKDMKRMAKICYDRNENPIVCTVIGEREVLVDGKPIDLTVPNSNDRMLDNYLDDFEDGHNLLEEIDGKLYEVLCRNIFTIRREVVKK